MVKRVERSEEEWREILSPETFRITRQKGTEPPFTGRYNDFEGEGMFRCAACGAPLFESSAKFESGSGWPSFTEPAQPDAVRTEEDRTFGMRRTEVLCAACDAHLGHVFPDGPRPTGLRYCINSGALQFEGEGEGEGETERENGGK